MIDPNTVLLVYSGPEFARVLGSFDREKTLLNEISYRCLRELSIYVNLFGLELEDADSFHDLICELNNYILDTVSEFVCNTVTDVPEIADAILTNLDKNLHLHMTRNDYGEQDVVSIILDMFPTELSHREHHTWLLTREYTELRINKFN